MSKQNTEATNKEHKDFVYVPHKHYFEVTKFTKDTGAIEYISVCRECGETK